MPDGRRLLCAVWLLGVAVPAAAQTTAVDVDRLPVSVDRIAQELRSSADRGEWEGLDLRYYVQIYGQSPPIDLFVGDANLMTGPVPYGAPTHREMLDHITPREFRTPPVDLNSLLRWLMGRLPGQTAPASPP